MPRVRIKKSTLWRGIRKFCLKCIGNSPREVELCTDPECCLYDYRFGRALDLDDPVYLPGTYKAGYGGRYRKNGKIFEYVNGKGWREVKVGGELGNA